MELHYHRGDSLNPVIDFKDAVTFISQLLKEQREICASKYVRADTVEESRQIVKNILNAPEPSELKGEKCT